MKRRTDLDNLRWMCVLLLFPYHTFTLYNNWGESYYIHLAQSPALSLAVKLCQPWFMPLLFLLSGVSTVYSLRKRTPGQYLGERCRKLLVPLVSGTLLAVPALTYVAERTHNGYTGGYLTQYRLFFSKTDLVGYAGGFTMAHLWFLAYLLAASLAALPLILLWKKRAAGSPPASLGRLLALFLPVWLCSYVLDISGKSLGRYFALFLLGATVLSREETQRLLCERRRILLLLWAAATALPFTAGPAGLLHDGLFQMTGWFGSLALLGLGQRHLNFSGPVARYFTRASFSLYIFHLPWIVLTAYWVSPLVPALLPQAALILAGSFLLTVGTYALARRSALLRALFAISQTPPRPAAAP